MIQKHTEIELQIDALAVEGDAITRHDGLICFVRGAVPGDRVRARIVKVKRNFAQAEVIEILDPSDQRASPQCPHFGICGGCKWQHVSYQAQLRAKQQHVMDVFERIGGFKKVEVSPIIGSEDVYFYRNKMEFSFSRQRWLTPEEMLRKELFAGEFGLGLHVQGRFDKVVNIDECWLQSTTSNTILNAVREFCRRHGLSAYSTKTHEGYLRHLVIREGKTSGEIMVNLVTTDDRPEIMRELTTELLARCPQITTLVNNITTRKSMVALGEEEKIYFGLGYITERLGRYTFRISANSFFQTNTKQAERLYEIVKTMGEFGADDVVYDLYCGTGTIATYVSDSVREVVGIDVVESAIADARLNAELNGVRNCRYVLGDLKDTLKRDTAWLSSKPAVVILDPPRSGLHPKVVQEVAALEPDRIIYISCNPATQARDAGMFREAGYEVTRLQPLDMFPHTYHVENVASLRKSTR